MQRNDPQPELMRWSAILLISLFPYFSAGSGQWMPEVIHKIHFYDNTEWLAEKRPSH